PGTGFGEDDLEDGLPDDDEVSILIVPQRVDISLVKTVDLEAPKIGDRAVFSIEVANLGPDVATHIGIEELLPSGYVFLGAETTLGTFDPGSLFWEIEELEASGKALLELTVEVLEE